MTIIVCVQLFLHQCYELSILNRQPYSIIVLRAIKDI